MAVVGRPCGGSSWCSIQRRGDPPLRGQKTRRGRCRGLHASPRSPAGVVTGSGVVKGSRPRACRQSTGWCPGPAGGQQPGVRTGVAAAGSGRASWVANRPADLVVATRPSPSTRAPDTPTLRGAATMTRDGRHARRATALTASRSGCERERPDGRDAVTALGWYRSCGGVTSIVEEWRACGGAG